MSKAVKKMTLKIDDVDCQYTKDLFEYLRSLKLRPYIHNNSATGYTVKVHYKSKYFLIKPASHKFQSEYFSSKYKWIGYKDFDNLVDKLDQNINGIFPPTDKQIKLLLDLASKFPDKFTSEEIESGMEDSNLCLPILQELIDLNNSLDKAMATPSQVSYCNFLLSSNKIDITVSRTDDSEFVGLLISELKDKYCKIDKK